MISKSPIVFVALCLAVALFGPDGAVSPAQSQTDDLSHYSIEELVHLNVTSVSKKAEKASEVAAALSVITGEDIRRSGATCVPEALRLAPGVQVARISSNRWAITIRGLNGALASNLLVLIDGRNVYTPLFSGVWWDTQDVMLEDIDRIEVIRGPGATLWGSNAVNGVINIFTKHTKDSQGLLMSGGAGSEERAFGNARFGGKVGEDASYRGYVKYFNRDDFRRLEGGSGDDAWDGFQTGLRTDAKMSEQNSVTLQGDAYRLNEDRAADFDPIFQPFIAGDYDTDVAEQGGNVLGRWTHTMSQTSDMQMQAYFDYVDREDGVISHTLATTDLDFQHRFSPLQSHDFLWGLNYRHYEDDVDGTANVSLDPESSGKDLYAAFVQDEITLTDDVKFVMGSKFEDNDYTGFEIQPNFRLAFTPTESTTLWAAISRAVRIPSRGENDSRNFNTVYGQTPEGLPMLVYGFGSDEVESVNLWAYEAGIRSIISEQVSIDVAAFYNVYSDFSSVELGEPYLEGVPPPPHVTIPVTSANRMSVDTAGGEVALELRPAEAWRLVSSYSMMTVDQDEEDSTDPGFYTNAEGESMRNQFLVRSLLNLSHGIELDSALRYVDHLRVSGGFRIPAYTELDVRLGWHATKSLEIAVVGQNLLNDDHLEWAAPTFGQPIIEVERGLYGKLTWKWS